MKTVNHVSAHLSTMCPVYTATQKKSKLPPGNPRLVGTSAEAQACQGFDKLSPNGA
ncbi:hypothetical protein [Polaromonas sp.]|uniref:hypothetical protein n=1 Tax=Polaromonas sp. TaxID=1869339 RepID=UPI003C987CBA